MASTQAGGWELNIPDVLNGINRLEAAIASLAKASEANTKMIATSFKSITEQGITPLITKLSEAQNALSNFNNSQSKQTTASPMAKTVDDINRLNSTLFKSYGVWQGLEKNISANESKMKTLSAETKRFEQIQANIKAGKGGSYSLAEKKQYEENLKTLEVLRLQNESWKQKQLAIEANNKMLRDQLGLLTSISSQSSTKKGGQQNFELQRMAQYYKEQSRLADEAIKKQNELSKQYQKTNLQKNTTYDGAKQFAATANTIERQKKAIDYLTQARAKLNARDAEGVRKSQELTNIIRQLEGNIKRATQSTNEYAQAQRKLGQARLDQYWSSNTNRAMNFSANTKNIQQQIRAINYLKQARDKLDRGSFSSTKAYEDAVRRVNAEIRRQQTEIDRLTGKARRGFQDMGSALSSVQSRIATLFGIDAMMGYVKKLISIRGEFEMQSKSLEILLKNKEKADELWSKTVQLAVKSPFTVLQLTKYTKQLAAYRIEADKLYETNKMLADVSAGLGVDMQRLILAYGQVKAANFLRGTELRQFSEAGVNMLDELAKRFTALEGRVVSVGEVFERISKRKVNFTDVDAVFRTITSEGGLFYKMQEEQSTTIKGMIMNLKDSFDLMFNDIGMSLQGFIKGTINAIKTLADNWRSLFPIVTFFGTLLSIWLIQKSLIPMIAVLKASALGWKMMKIGITQSTTAMKAFAAAQGAAANINPWMALISVLLAAGMAIWALVTDTDKLATEVGRLKTSLSDRLQESIEQYISLAEKVKDATATVKEQNEALKKIQTTFAEMLPQRMLTIDFIYKEKQAYEEVTDALKLYYDELAQKQERSKIEEIHGGKVTTQKVDLGADFRDIIEAGNFSEEMKNYLLANIGGIISEVVQKVKDGEIEATFEGVYKGIFDKITELTGETEQTFFANAMPDPDEWSGVLKNIIELTDALSDYNDAMSAVSGLPDIAVSFQDKGGFEKASKAYDDATEALKQYATTAEKISTGQILGTEPIYGIMSPETIAEINVAMETLSQIPEGITELGPKAAAATTKMKNDLIKAAKEGKVAFQEALPAIQSEYLATMATIVRSSDEGNTAVENLSETISQAAANKKLPEWAKSIYDVMRDFAEDNNQDLDIFSKFIPDASKSFSEYQTLVKDGLDELKEIKKQYNTMSQDVQKSVLGWSLLEAAGVTSKEALDAKIELIETYSKAIGIYDKKDKSSKTKKEDDRPKRRIKLIQDMRKAYEDLSKVFNKTTAQEKILNSFSDEAKELGIAIKDMDVSTIKGTLDALNAIESLVKKNKKAYVEFNEAVRDLKLELEKSAKTEYIENLKRNMDDVFAKYDLGKELEKLHIPKELAMNLFDVDVSDLKGVEKTIDAQSKGLISAVKEYRKTFKETYAVDKEEKEKAEKAKKTIVDKFSKDEFDAAMDFLKKYEEAEKKSLEERLKNYAKYTEKALSSLGKINVNALNEMAEVEKLYEDIVKNLIEQTGQSKEDVLKTATGQQATAFRDAAIEGINEKRKEDFDKEKWEIFKSTAMYEQMFDDISKMGELAVNQLLDNLRTLKGSLADLPFETRKAIEDSISKLEDRSREFNPFKTFKDDLKDIQKLQTYTYTKGQETLTGRKAIETQLGDVTAQITKDKERLAVLESINAAQENYASLILLGIDMNATENQGLTAQEAVTKRIGKLRKDITDNEQKATDLGNDLSKFTDVLNSAEKVKKTTEDWAKELGGVLKGVDDILAAFGVAEDSAARIAIDMASVLLDAAVNAASLYVQMELLKIQAKLLGEEMNMAMGVIGWIAMALQAVASILTAVFQAHDKSLQRQIDSLADGVEKLEKAFESLEKSIEKAFDISSLKSDWNSAMTNIDQRIAKTAKMISLEKKKKSTDDDAIKDYENQMAELEEKRQELMEETIESLGGVVDFRSVTREFVDAWYDAFKETGNGLEGLKDNFTDFFANVVAEQAVMTGAGKIMQPLFDEINKSLEGDFEVTAQEYANIDAKQAEQLKKLDTFLTEYYEKYGNILASGDQLSGLQKGIQGITEEQADILAAYWSSVRFFVANIDTTLTNLATHIFGQATATDNPMISQLKLIASNTTAINNLLDNVTKGGHPKGGQGIKVFIN